MKLVPVPMLALASGLALATAGCGGNGSNDNGASNATATDTATPAAADTSTASGHAGQFLTDAIQGDNSEVKLGKLAEDQGGSKGVKDFGKMLEQDHSKAKDQASQVADALNVPVPDSATPEADAEYTKLQGMKGADFDKEFVSYMVNDHQKDIDKFQQEAASSDPMQVTDMAKQTLPTLKKHLQTAQSLQK